MTGPNVGRVEAELRIDTTHVDADVKKGLEKAGADATHEQTGRSIAQGMERGLERELETVAAPRASSAFARGLRRARPSTIPISPVADIEGVTRFAERLGMMLANLFSGKSNNPAVKLGQSLGKAIEQGLGSVFNVSGRGPGGALMVVAIGSLLYLVAGLIQGIQALGAVILALPAALGAVALEAGVLYLAFKGVGTAITAAFSAKTPEELDAALKGLTPDAQTFVRSLLPLKDIFKTLQGVAQGNLFAAFNQTGAIAQFISFLGNPKVASSIAYLAQGLGNVFGALIKGVSSPSFQKFVELIGPAGFIWLTDFANALSTLMEGFNNLATATIPFFSSLGAGFNGVLRDFGNFLTRIANDPKFQQWLEDMRPILTEFSDALMSIALWLGAVFYASQKANEGLKKAFGQDVLQSITAVFQGFAAFIASPNGIHAFQGLIEVLTIAFYSMVVGIYIIGELLAAFDYLYRWAAVGIEGLVAFFTDLWHAISDGPEKAKNAFVGFLSFLFGLVGILINIWTQFKENAKEKLDGFIAFFTDTIPNAIGDFIKKAPDMLYDAGKNILQGLINGINDAFPGLTAALGGVGQLIKDHFPHSPAKTGPLSGEGDPKFAGAEIVNRLAAGMDLALPSLRATTTNAASTVNFGPGSITNTYNNASPALAQQHAMAMVNQMLGLFGRDTRLAVRTLGATT